MTTDASQDSGPLITIAIPTYNRSNRLQQTLERLLTQQTFMSPDVEIVVSDNASTDDTSEMIRVFAARTGKPIRLHRNERNLGIDGNIHTVGQLAKGEFILFMSDDDILRPGGLLYLRELIQRFPALVFAFLNAGAFEGEFDATRPLKSVIGVDDDISTLSNNDFITKIGFWSTFVSSFFVKRTAWQGVPNPQRFVGTDIYLTHVLYRLLAAAPESVKFISGQQLVAARAAFTGSFRILHAFASSFLELVCKDALQLGYSREATRAVKLHTIKQGLPSMTLMVRRAAPGNALSAAERRTLFEHIWYEPVTWTRVAPVALLPWSWLQSLVHVRRKLRRSRTS